MIKQQWAQISSRIDAMSLRERAMIFSAVAFLLVTLVNMFLLDPMLSKQKNLSSQVVQQLEKMKEIQSQIDRYHIDRHSYVIAVGGGAGSSIYDWLATNATGFGFVRTVSGEPWHWEFRPAAAHEAKRLGKHII